MVDNDKSNDATEKMRLMYKWMAQAAINIENPVIPSGTAEGKLGERTIEINRRIEIQRLWDSDQSYQSYLNSLCDIELFVLEVLANDGPGIRLTENKLGKMTLEANQQLGNYFNKVRRFSDAYSVSYIFSEHVQLFFNCWIELELGNEPFNKPGNYSSKVGLLQYEVFNDLLELIRLKAREAEFKTRLRMRREKSSKRCRGARSYINRLFENHSEMEVIRIDLSYRNDRAIIMTAERAKEDLQKFKNNLRGKWSLFKNMAGHIWKLSWAPEKGFHFHLILLFGWSEACNGEDIAQQVGEYWIQQICKGYGVFMNCNTSKNSDRNSGTGKIKAEDQKKIALVEVIERMAKIDQYLRATSLGEGKLFGHGEIKSVMKSKTR